jgi:hypothetical protein
MKGSFIMIASRLFKFHRGWAAAMVFLASSLAHTVGQAETTYTLSGEFTSFRTWVTTAYPSPASVGGIALVDSGQFAGTYLGQSFNWSQTVVLPPDTTTVDFTYVAVPPDSSVYSANNFSFAPGAEVSVDPGVPFTLGSISFTNGQWFYRTELGVHFSATSLADGTVNEFDDTLVLLSNSPTPPYTPQEQADYFYLAGHPELGSVRVFDSFSQPADNPGSTGTVDFIAQIGSLDPLAFRPTNSAAFVSDSLTPNPSSVVPEPSTWTMVLIGLLVMATVAMRRTGSHTPTETWRLMHRKAG